ncbi:MAG: transglutaminase family protein [Leptospiraceae bacterium]|nr:transglutaminase family protein [Leptospiraceae bacterium]
MENDSHAKTREIGLLLTCFAETRETEPRKVLLDHIVQAIPFGAHPQVFIDGLTDPAVRLMLREIHGELLNRRKLAYDLTQSMESGRLDLETGVFLISRLGPQRDLTLEDFRAALDELAEPLIQRLEEVSDPMDRIDLFREYLFREKAFRGNTEDYYDPENSYLTSVLKSGKGIPVSLSVLAILVARRAGLPVEGVNLPGHFIIKYDTPDLKLFLDPFNEGNYLTEEECFHFLIRQGIQPDNSYLGATSTATILKRMYRNLINYFSSTKNRTLEKTLREHFAILEKYTSSL